MNNDKTEHYSQFKLNCFRSQYIRFFRLRSQTSHKYGLFPECVLLCVFKLQETESCLLQTSHSYDLYCPANLLGFENPLCVAFICLTKWLDWENIFLHTSHS